MTDHEAICQWILDRAAEVCKSESASVVFSESSDNTPVVLDMESGRTFRVRLEEF